MHVKCPLCNRWIPTVELDFCPFCRLYIGAPRPFRIMAEDFSAPEDRGLTDTLREAVSLDEMVSRALTILWKPRVWNILLGGCPELDFRHPLWGLIMNIAGRLCLDKAPRIFLCENEGSTFTMGSNEDPLIMVGRPILRSVGLEELKAILAHEIAHIKARHMEYLTILRLILGGFLELTGGSLATNLVMDLLFKRWRRAAELTADRGSLIATGDISPMKTALLKLHGYDPSGKGPELRDRNRIGEIIKYLGSHPDLKDRIEALEAFYTSREYRDARRKMEMNEEVRKVFRGEGFIYT